MAERGRDVARWLPAARAGSSEALGQALEACRGYLLLIAEKELDPQLRAKGGASDLVQETFLKAHRHFARFEGDTEAELLAWLRRLLLNNLADFQALYRETDKRQVGREVALGTGSSSGAVGGEPEAGHSSPSHQAMAHERDEELHRALDRLPDDYRRVLRLRYEEERSFEEIGRQLGRSANAARKLWERAVDRLEQELEGPHEP
jgi:RNA polymerase sigma-70 factor (ECF subfamily)